ncbi:MAG: YraN family protein, partial [Clostridia bacterium]
SKKNVLAFVEVKLRKDKSYGEAREFVTKIKQSKIKLTAESYIASSSTALQPRFDVIEIYAPNGISKNYTINHIENAFE